MKEVLGLDIGGVIIDSANDKADTSLFGDNYIHALPVEGAIEGISSLAQRFGGDIYLVSKARPRTQSRTLEWMDHNRFFDQTGIKPQNIHFVRKREDKAGIARELNISHFVDDKLEVLSYLPFIPNLYLFNPTFTEVARYEEFLASVKVVDNWRQLSQSLISE